MRCALDGVPAVGIGLDLVAHRSSQQLVDRLRQQLAHNIPAGDLDGGNGGHGDLSSPCIIVHVHAMHQIFDVGRVVTQDVIGHSLREIAEQGISVVQHAFMHGKEVGIP